MPTQSSEFGELPIPAAVITDVADEQNIDRERLVLALVSVHDATASGADAIVQHYDDEETPESRSGADGRAAVVFVDEEQWAQLPVTLSADEEAAVKAVHAAYARELGADEESVETTTPLVVPSKAVGELMRAGLSRRQAEIQVLRRQGHDRSEIADTFGVADSTVRVHVHRIERKVEDAKRLLELVEE